MNWVTTKFMCVLLLFGATPLAHAQDAVQERSPAPAEAEARSYGLQLRAMEHGELRTPPCPGYCPYCGNCYSYPTWPEHAYGWPPSALDSALRAARLEELGRMIAVLVEEHRARGDSLRETEQR